MIYETVALPLSYIGFSLSTNPHVLNVPYFGRVNVHGKSIRHLPDTLVVLAVRCKPTAQSKASLSSLRQAGCPSGLSVLRMSLPPMQTHAQCVRSERGAARLPGHFAEGWLSG